MKADDLFGMFDESARLSELKAAAQQEIGAAIERRFCLLVCAAIVGAERGVTIINRVCDQAIAEADDVVGASAAKELFGADFMRNIVEHHRAALLDVLHR